MIDTVQQVLSCRVEEFPSRYLGVPLSIYRLSRASEQPLIDSIAARIPTWKGNLLNAAGRATLVKAALSAVPVHTATALCLSPWAIGRIDRIRRSFLWGGAAQVAGGRCKVAWGVVSRPTYLGGLRVADLNRAGLALRLRWPWLRRTDMAMVRAWQGLADGEDRAASALFCAATYVTVRPPCFGRTLGFRVSASGCCSRRSMRLYRRGGVGAQWRRPCLGPPGCITYQGRGL